MLSDIGFTVRRADVPLPIRQLGAAQALTQESDIQNWDIMVTGGPAVAAMIGYVHRRFSNLDFISEEKNMDNIGTFLRHELGLRFVRQANSKLVFDNNDLVVNYVMLKDEGEHYTFSTEHYFDGVRLSKKFFKPYRGKTRLFVGDDTFVFRYDTIEPTMLYCSKLFNKGDNRKIDYIDLDLIEDLIDNKKRREIIMELNYL